MKPTGSVYVCGFSEILTDLKHPASQYFKHCRWLIWHYKNKASLEREWERSHESIIHFRKLDAARLNIDDVRTPYGAHYQHWNSCEMDKDYLAICVKI